MLLNDEEEVDKVIRVDVWFAKHVSTTDSKGSTRE